MTRPHPLTACAVAALLCSSVVLAGDDCCRVFMAADGAQASQPTSGATLVTVDQGQTVTIMAWIQATQAQMLGTGAYQLIWEVDAIPEPGAVGTVAYVDGQMGVAGVGDSVLVDTTRADHLFALQTLAFDPVYCEMSGGPGCGFGTITALPQGVGIDVTSGVDVPLPGEPMYLAQFQMEASGDACGPFSLTFNKINLGDDPPGTGIFGTFGALWNEVVFQPLTIYVDCCGNGTLDPGEDCEPPGGCCTDTCQLAGAGEVCAAGDGNCVLPATCDGSSTACPDNIIIGDCVNGDGCCPGAFCTAIDDSDCPAICGNGTLEPDECCDDGNTEECDGCSPDCLCEAPCVAPVPALTGWGMGLLVLALLVGVACVRRAPARP